MVAVPLVLAVNRSPFGSRPVSVIVAVGYPVVVTLNLIARPTEAVTAFAEVMAGAWSTRRRKLCVADPAALVAFTVSRRLPPVPAAGVPAKVAVPFGLAVKLSPLGSAPDSVRLAIG